MNLIKEDLILTETLKQYGWNDQLQAAYEEIISRLDCPQALLIGRIMLDHGQRLLIFTTRGEMWIQRPSTQAPEATMPLAVGDWVIASQDKYEATLGHFLALLPRKTKFSRLAAGIEVKEQIVAANVDIVFLVQSLNNDFNPRRLERYLIATWESGARPVVILTKRDLCQDFASKIQIVNDIAFGVDVHAISSISGDGLEAILPYFKPGHTIALLGSSGVGKSTLVNKLVGENILATNDIREYDSKGRHTTTHRELVLLPSGGLILDTPGMRSLALWEADEGMQQMFGDITALINQCRFQNCSHRKEPDCAVQAALKAGHLKYTHWESWVKLQKEQKILEAKLWRKERQLDKLDKQHKEKKDTKSVVVRRIQSEY